MKPFVAVLAVLSLVSCSSLDFYAPEVNADWSTQPVVSAKGEVSVDGVTVKKLSESYSEVVSVGTLLTPAYQGGRQEVWSVQGPGGLSATVELIQTGLVFMGPVTKNVLNSNSIDYTDAKQYVRVTRAGQADLSPSGAIASPPAITVAGLGIEPSYQGVSGGKVSDYKSWGLATGLRLTKDGNLAGYLNLTNGASLKKAAGASVDPLLTALAMVSAQAHFDSQPPLLSVVPEVFEIFGLKVTTQVTHN